MAPVAICGPLSFLILPAELEEIMKYLEASKTYILLLAFSLFSRETKGRFLRIP